MKIDTTKEVLEKVVPYIPQMANEPYISKLRKALKNRTENESIKRLVGEYPLDINVNEFHLNKIREKQGEIEKVFIRNFPNVPFVFNPTDYKVVFVPLEDGRVSRKKISDFAIQLTTEDQKEVNRIMTGMPSKSASDTVRLVITDKPEDILRKSSSRSWSQQSCEIIGGSFGGGPFSDIEHDNAIAYFFVGDNVEPMARIMIRWCENDKKEIDIGIEPIVYPRDLTTAGVLIDELKKVIMKKGYGKYENCVTPYIYKGYSDISGTGKVRITYHPLAADSSLVRYAADPNVSRNVALFIAQHGSVEVRRALAENEGILKYNELKDKLLKDSDESVVKNYLGILKDVDADVAMYLLKKFL